MAQIPPTTLLGRAIKGIEKNKEGKRIKATQELFSWYAKTVRDEERRIRARE